MGGTEIKTREAKSASHNCGQNLHFHVKMGSTWLIGKSQMHTYNSGSLFAALFRISSFPFDLLAVSAALEAAEPTFAATRPAAADMTRSKGIG